MMYVDLGKERLKKGSSDRLQGSRVWSNLAGPETLSKEFMLLLLMPDPSESL